jgi:hypothetical protein
VTPSAPLATTGPRPSGSSPGSKPKSPRARPSLHRHDRTEQKTYGAIGGVIVALLWFYVTSLAILIGAQLDATIERAAKA